MATVEGLDKVQGLVSDTNQILDVQVRQQAAKQAADLFKSGDIKGALGTLAAVDPEHAASMFQQFQQFDPTIQQNLHQAQAQGMTQGQYNVTTPAGANPRQLLDASLASKEAIASEKAAAPKPGDTVVRTDPNSPTGFSLVNKKTGEKVAASQAGLPDQTTKDGTTAPKLRSNEDINSNGDKVMLSPAEQKIIKETRKAFDSETKDIVKGIDASQQALELINKNIPGSGTLEKLRLLRGVVQGRINQQEFQAFGKGQGAINSIDNAISEAAGKGMSPKVQDLMRQMATVAIQLQSREYDQHLRNAVERNPEVDPLILKKRLVGSGPTVYQALSKKVEALPPEDQAAFNWAHDNANDPRAKAILQKLGF